MLGFTTPIPMTLTAYTIPPKHGMPLPSAYTDLVRITEPDTNDYAPVAPKGGLSPFSTTSLTVAGALAAEAGHRPGNAAKDSLSAVWSKPADDPSSSGDQLFTTTNATSAAAALASRLAAQVMAVYPGL